MPEKGYAVSAIRFPPGRTPAVLANALRPVCGLDGAAHAGTKTAGHAASRLNCPRPRAFRKRRSRLSASAGGRRHRHNRTAGEVSAASVAKPRTQALPSVVETRVECPALRILLQDDVTLAVKAQRRHGRCPAASNRFASPYSGGVPTPPPSSRGALPQVISSRCQARQQVQRCARGYLA
jgi:hypothetical protein